MKTQRFESTNTLRRSQVLEDVTNFVKTHNMTVGVTPEFVAHQLYHLEKTGEDVRKVKMALNTLARQEVLQRRRDHNSGAILYNAKP